MCTLTGADSEDIEVKGEVSVWSHSTHKSRLPGTGLPAKKGKPEVKEWDLQGFKF